MRLPGGKPGPLVIALGAGLHLPALFFFALILLSCLTSPAPLEAPPPTTPLPTTPLPIEIPELVLIPRPSGGGISDEIRINTETGTPSSLLTSLDIILSRNLASTEFGRTMLNVNATLLRTLYPALQLELPPQDPPITHSYSRILREAERGIYTAPQRNSNDFLEHVLPFLAYYPGFSGMTFSPENYLSTLPHLEKAITLNEESALAHYFMGTAFEKTGRLEEALLQYSNVWNLFPESYPAALGIARIRDTQGRKREAIQFLSGLAFRFPDNLEIKRQLAFAHYNYGDLTRAKATAEEILQVNSRDADFVLMTAHIHAMQGSLPQAQPYLDIYAGINPTNTLYLFLNARLQNEVFQNRPAAINSLRTLMRVSHPADTVYDEASVYFARLLIDSPRPQEQQEGRALLRRLLSVPLPSLDVISLALADAIRLEEWREARTYLTRLLAERRSSEDLLAAYTVESMQGNNAVALSFARELYDRDRSNDEGILAYASALIESGRRTEAARMIDNRLNSISGGTLKSRYHYLRSRTRDSEELILSDLRSSLFENPRNINALIATFEIYHNRNDERRAVHYLRQAIALAPENPRLRRYAAEYDL
jgi:tetratricopeptide (TPR) repeat protein